jgi:PleD family two-component response regulator
VGAAAGAGGKDRGAHLLSRISQLIWGARGGASDFGSGRLSRFGAAAIRLAVNPVHEGFARDSFRTSIDARKTGKDFRGFGEGSRVLRILIVEDDSQLAITLKYLVEDNPRYRVVAMADDADTAIGAAEDHDPDLVLLDLHLAHGTTGFSVAVRLNDLGVPCLFVSG